MKTSQNQHAVRSTVLRVAIRVLRNELRGGASATIRNQLELLDVVASELRDLAETPDVDEPEQHPLYVSGKALAEMMIDNNYLGAHRRAAARAFLELAKQLPSSADDTARTTTA